MDERGERRDGESNRANAKEETNKQTQTQTEQMREKTQRPYRPSHLTHKEEGRRKLTL